jgi:hypothetical protein
MRLSITGLLAAVLLMGAASGAARAQDFVYVVRPGDTLIGIGARWLTDSRKWVQLVKPNKISDPDYIRPHQSLRIPLQLMRSETERATVVHVQGKAEIDGGRTLARGDSIGAGADLTTGADGYVTLELADGSRLTLPAQSRLRVLELTRYSNTELRVSRVSVVTGRIEALVKKLGSSGDRFEVDTPTAAIGVRGTDFRAGVGASAAAVRAEVLDGAVGLRSTLRQSDAEVPVAAGYGAVADAGGKVSAPVPLLGAPNVAQLPRLQERLLVRFQLEPVAGVAAYRAQAVRAAQPDEVMNEQVAAGNEIRMANLADGDYVLQLRAIDALGLEGRESQHAFRLKARPEPPFTAAPPNRGKLRATGVEFSWATVVGAARYRFQLAQDERFATLVDEVRATQNVAYSMASLAPGEYHWRVASIRADGDQGPFGDVQRFQLLPPPRNPDPPREEGNQLVFSWGAEPGQTFEFQLARDPAFGDVVANLKLREARVPLDRPGAGRYYMRVRAIDADGYVGPYTATQSFELPNCLTSAATGQCVGAGSPGQLWLLR